MHRSVPITRAAVDSRGTDILLIESLDAVGSSADDARARLSALNQAGFTAHALVVAAGRSPTARPGESGRQTQWIEGHAALAAAARTSQARAPHALALVASGPIEAGALARALPPGLEARWWPTALAAANSAPGAFAAGVLRPSPPALTLDALEGAIAEPARGGRSHPLWDGDYVLAPVPLAAPSGTAVLEAFARAARERSALDLVVLADPQPEFERLAQALGIGVRVHFAGPAPGPAEASWLRAAAAVLLPAEATLAASLVLRVLDAGALPVVVGGGAPADILRRWLSARGCAAGAGAPGTWGAAESLGWVLDRGSAVETAIARGREEAGRHRPGAMTERVRAWLPEIAPHRGRLAA